MSAICGIFYKKGVIKKNEADSMMKKLGKVKHNKEAVVLSENYFAGIYQLFLNKESKNEILPFEDKETNWILNGDIILYNRDELFEELNIHDQNINISDSQLVLISYKKWNKSCVDHLVGSFAFVIWDKVTKELFIARDHTGKKTFYYYNSDEIFVFSSLIEPIFEISQIKRRLNDEYISDFLSMISVSHDLNPVNTIYEKILQLPPAHTMLVNKKSVSFREYWRVEKKKEIKYNSDDEYERAFCDLFRNVVKSRIRTNKNVGILLSGGLDSTSVACFAADELKKQEKFLYSYTQIPIKTYKNYIPQNKLADETEYVEETIKYSGNILPKFIDSEGKNMYTEINVFLDIYEQPYKIFENSTWIKEIQKTAFHDNCKFLLTGQAGNATISWGNHSFYMKYLLKSFKLITFFKETKAYSQKNNRNVIKYRLYNIFILSSFITWILTKLRVLNKKDGIILSPVNKEFSRKMKTQNRFKKHNSFNERYLPLRQSTFSHLGAIENKLAMYSGVEESDPTCDKRIIDFCMNLPENQWVRDGKERRFIRLAMKDLIADKIRLNETIRGSQAADYIQRIIPQWEEIRKEMLTIGDNQIECKYLNIPLIKELLNKYEKIEYDTDGNKGIRLLFRALIFTRFLRRVSNNLDE